MPDNESNPTKLIASYFGQREAKARSVLAKTATTVMTRLDIGIVRSAKGRLEQ